MIARQEINPNNNMLFINKAIFIAVNAAQKPAIEAIMAALSATVAKTLKVAKNRKPHAIYQSTELIE